MLIFIMMVFSGVAAVISFWLFLAIRDTDSGIFSRNQRCYKNWYDGLVGSLSAGLGENNVTSHGMLYKESKKGNTIVSQARLSEEAIDSN